MFVMTLSKGLLKKVGIACACTAVLAATAIGVTALRSDDTDSTGSVHAAAALDLQMSSADDLIVFLQSYGVEADVATATVSTVTVPKQWDDSFDAFNEVIEQSGLTLDKVKGKEVDKWSLLIPAQSTEDIKTYAIVLVQDKSAVAAYILQKPSGEVLPLVKAAQTASPLTDEEINNSDGFADGAEVVIVADGTADAVPNEDTAPVEGIAPTQDVTTQDVQATAQYDESVMPTE